MSRTQVLTEDVARPASVGDKSPTGTVPPVGDTLSTDGAV